jgi:phospholipid-translocating ATPase
MFCFFLTTIGWWAWSGFLSGIYTRAPSIYAVRDGFTSTFGRDPVWWATLFVVLAALGALDLGLRLAKRALIGMGLWTWPPVWLGGRGEDDVDKDVWDVEVWQEMEQDPAVWARLKALSEEDIFAQNSVSQGDEER